MKETRNIEVVPYNPLWPKLFAEEATSIQKALGSLCIAIHHVGSTAVPGLPAKPKIDIIAEIEGSPEEAIQKLEAAGFSYRGEYNIPFHYGFNKREGTKVNLHVYEKDHPEVELNLTFRDYLKIHPETREEYGALKLKLLEDKSSFEKNNSMFTGYNLRKDALIRKILKKTGFNRLRFLRCTHIQEWDKAKQLRQHYFFDKASITDPYQWTFTHPDHVHFVLCKGTDVIGYAHIQLWPESRAALRIIVVEEAYQHQGLGKQFLEWIEKWLRLKGYRSLHTEASPDALKFYEAQGYTNMPFNDPDGHPTDKKDTPLGKFI